MDYILNVIDMRVCSSCRADVNDIEIKRFEVISFLVSFLILSIGGMIYLFFRPHYLRMFFWLKKINLESYFIQCNFNKNSRVMNFLIYSLPNGLWQISALICFSLILKNNRSYLIFSCLFCFTNLGFEVFQNFTTYLGTFDLQDITALISSFFLGFIFNHIYLKELQKWQKKKLKKHY